MTINNEFVIRDLKIVNGTRGPFVAMPSRKLMDRCARCGGKNHIRANYCNDCGSKLSIKRSPQDAPGRIKLHADIAHPINSTCREELQEIIIKAYEEEIAKSKSPGYEPQELFDLQELGTGNEQAEPPAIKADYPEEQDAPPGEPEPESPPETHRKSEDGFGDGIFT
jgi:stage V sporulation protein G